MLTLDLSGWPVWRYTVANPRASADPQWIAAVALPIQYPITNPQAPPNWEVSTDNKAFVIWYSPEPFASRDIQPQTSLTAFTFESQGDWQCGTCALLYYNHQTNTQGANERTVAPVPTAPLSGVPTPRALQQPCPKLTANTPDHFYTISTVERDEAVAHAGFTNERVECSVYAQPAPGTTPLYRLFSYGTGDHFYTINERERDEYIAQHGYSLEGVECHVFAIQTFPPSGRRPLYRLFNPANGDHFYTIDAAERNTASAQYGYTDHGVACYVFGAPGVRPPPPVVSHPGTTPLFRLRRVRPWP